MACRSSLFRRFFLLLLTGTLLVAGTAALAQRPARAATRLDSLRAARDGAPTFFPALFTLSSGKQVRGYVKEYSTCLLERVACYELPPDRLPPPPVKAISIERLRSLSVDGHTLEALSIKGKPLGILAENLASPGPLQIYGYAKTKNDMLLPIPIGPPTIFVSTGTHEKYYWFVRQVGGELQEVPRDQKGFVKLMSQLCAPVPALVTELQRPPAGPTKAERQPRYRVDNAPELISAYNAALAKP
ncbi:hypothetical protein [uncultured Hymenobacter sp.]|uniref:hypothetical protein n=1 Tax=uncultured Hymenobacter sp. TaxID=170016 RepID=UPI0035CB2ADE